MLEPDSLVSGAGRNEVGAVNTSNYNWGHKPWDVQIAGGIGKAMPNEVTKLNSLLQYIPYLGWLTRGMSALDTGGTTYDDIYSQGRDLGYTDTQARQKALMPAIQGGIGSFMGGSANPGRYGSGSNQLDRNWADYAGLAGNLWGSYKGGSYGGLAGGGLDIYDAFRGEGSSTRGYDVWNNQQNVEDPDWENWVRRIANLANYYQQYNQKA